MADDELLYIKVAWKSTSYIDIFEKVIRFTLNTTIVECLSDNTYTKYCYENGESNR